MKGCQQSGKRVFGRCLEGDRQEAVRSCQEGIFFSESEAKSVEGSRIRASRVSQQSQAESEGGCQ